MTHSTRASIADLALENDLETLLAVRDFVDFLRPSNREVTKISVITGTACGGAYIVMASKHIGDDCNYAWPTAELGVMAAEGEVEISFREEDAEGFVEKTPEYHERFANPLVAAAKGFVDEVIYPHSRRRRSALAQRKLRHKSLENPRKRHGNIPH